MIDVRSTTNKKLHLLHFLLQFIQENNPSLLSWTSEIPSIEAAIRVDMGLCWKGSLELERKLNDLSSLLNQRVSNEVGKFYDEMLAFYERACVELELVKESVADLTQIAASFLNEFGEQNVEVLTPLESIHIFSKQFEVNLFFNPSFFFFHF